MKKKDINRLVVLQAFFMSLGTFLSRILGFLRDLCIAAFFSKTETDIFFIAFRFPNFFRRILGEGSFSASVTPVLTEALYTEEGKVLTKRIHAITFTLIFVLTCFLTLLGVIFMKEIMELFFAQSAYGQVEGKLEKTILLGRLVFTYLFFVSIYSYLISVAQVFGRFFLPALAPAFFNLSLILFSFTPQSWWPFPSFSLGWAVIFGGVIQLMPVLYEMYRIGMLPRLTFKIRNPFVFDMGRRFLPSALGLSGLSLIGLINVYFSGWLEEGAPSYIYYSDRLMEFPRSLIAVSIGTALVPECARLFSVGKIADIRNTVSYHLRFVCFLTLPCAMVFFIIPQPVIELLFGRGAFDRVSVINTSIVLQMYSVVLVVSSMSRILSSCFFAINRNWYIVISTFAFVFFHAFCARIFTSVYGLKGLAGATALSSVFYFFVLSGGLFYLIGGLHLKAFFTFLARIFPGLCVFVFCLSFQSSIFYFLFLFLPSFLSLFLSLFFILFFGGVFYVLSGFLLKDNIAIDFFHFFKRLLRVSK